MTEVTFTREYLLRCCGLDERSTILDQPVTGLQIVGAIKAMQEGYTMTGVAQAIVLMAPTEPEKAA